MVKQSLKQLSSAQRLDRSNEYPQLIQIIEDLLGRDHSICRSNWTGGKTAGW